MRFGLRKVFPPLFLEIFIDYALQGLRVDFGATHFRFKRLVQQFMQLFLIEVPVHVICPR
jgi:hypothetical protein